MQVFEQYQDIAFILMGLLGLFFGGEGLIRGAVAIAARLHIPKLVVGLTIVGFGTSLPELMVSLKAVQSGAGDVAVGNVVGSNIANVLLIGGLSALIRPISTRSKGTRRDALVMMLVSAGLVWLAVQGGITRNDGLIMAGILVVYMAIVFLADRKAMVGEVADDLEGQPLSLPVGLLFVAAGLLFLVLGADFLVRGATSIATELGVSQAVIGLTLVAVGTSLPELTIGVIAAIRGQNELSLGNIVGSNIFNILAVLGVTAAVAPFGISPNFLTVDLPLMIAASLVIGAMVFFAPRFGRIPALACLAVYGLYMVWLARGPQWLALLG